MLPRTDLGAFCQCHFRGRAPRALGVGLPCSISMERKVREDKRRAIEPRLTSRERPESGPGTLGSKTMMTLSCVVLMEAERTSISVPSLSLSLFLSLSMSLYLLLVAPSTESIWGRRGVRQNVLAMPHWTQDITRHDKSPVSLACPEDVLLIMAIKGSLGGLRL